MTMDSAEFRNLLFALMKYIESAFEDGEYDDYTAETIRGMLLHFDDEAVILEYTNRLDTVQQIIEREGNEC